MSKFKSGFPKISSLVLIVAGHRIQCGTVSSSSPQRGQVALFVESILFL